jgi:hypothetical protein
MPHTYPLLEVLFDGARPEMCLQVAEHDEKGLPRSETPEGVADLERIVEELTVVVDSR